jgi:mRNA-degrading endonuclease toxin of MazEF toxin-antitoxin module
VSCCRWTAAASCADAVADARATRIEFRDANEGDRQDEEIAVATRSIDGSAFEVPSPCGEPSSAVVLADALRAPDWRARHAVFTASLPRPMVQEVQLTKLMMQDLP